jgi:hypothetical protein
MTLLFEGFLPKNFSKIFAPVRVREILGVWHFNWSLEATAIISARRQILAE